MGRVPHDIDAVKPFLRCQFAFPCGAGDGEHLLDLVEPKCRHAVGAKQADAPLQTETLPAVVRKFLVNQHEIRRKCVPGQAAQLIQMRPEYRGIHPADL
ncbi:MAG: hypothetical protein BWY76_03457 [bacterium ADurb.Bin429]|nr:MAG: hypothetical protein BWY76_03457 [bacterium ADurb.Bin429]